MARAPKNEAPPAGEPKRTNELTDEQRHALFQQHFASYRKLEAAFKNAQKALKDEGKKIKADLGANGLDMIKLTIRLEGDSSDEAQESAKSLVLDTLRVLRWSGLPIGHTDDLFSDFDARPLEEQAFDAGKIAGARGEAMNAPQRWATGDLYQAWCRGWNKGQEEVFDIKPTAQADGGTSTH